MSRYKANTVIDNRYLLTENLSYDAISGRQVWAATDKQTGKKFIGRFEPNGRVEWFDDNRPTSQTTTPPASKPPRQPAINNIKQLEKSKRRPFLPALVFGGALLLAVVYGRREEWLSYLRIKKMMWEASRQEVTSEQPEVVSIDTEMVTPRESRGRVALPAEPTDAPAPVTDAIPTPATDTDWRQVAIRLDRLSRQPEGRQSTLFAEAERSFSNLKRTTPNEAIVDSLHILYRGRGANADLDFRQNGLATSKNYAVRWYKLAYILEPSGTLKERIDRLIASPVRDRPPKKPTTPRNTGFEPDPELNKRP